MPAVSSTARLPDRAAPLAPRALYQDVAERLRQQIFNRELEPGSWIDEQKIAAEYGISRTPMREALKVLAVEGLVTMKVRRGAYVTEMSRTDVTQVYHLLALLEGDAAGQVAHHASENQRMALQALHQQLERQVRQREAFFNTNEAWHLAILQAAGNRWALQLVQDLRKVMKLNRHLSLFKQGRLGESLAEHRAIMAAIADRNAQEASRLMRAHFDNGLAAAAGPDSPNAKDNAKGTPADRSVKAVAAEELPAAARGPFDTRPAPRSATKPATKPPTKPARKPKLVALRSA